MGTSYLGLLVLELAAEGPYLNHPSSGRLRFALWKGADWPGIRKWGRNRGRSHFSNIGQSEFKNGTYGSGQSLLNTRVRLQPTRSAKWRLPITFLAHGKSRLEQ
jgi:hypothetical protein